MKDALGILSTCNTVVIHRTCASRLLTNTHTNQGRRHSFKSVGTKRDSPAKRARKKICTPHIWKSGGVQFFYTCGVRATRSKQITISIEYTEICCLAVVLIGLYYRPSRPIINQRRRQFHVSVVNKIGTACIHQVLYSSWNSVTCIEQSKKTSKDCLLCCRNRGLKSMLSTAQDAAWIKKKQKSPDKKTQRGLN